MSSLLFYGERFEIIVALWYAGCAIAQCCSDGQPERSMTEAAEKDLVKHYRYFTNYFCIEELSSDDATGTLVKYLLVCVKLFSCSCLSSCFCWVGRFW
jgi:hypothetical protein